MKYPLFTLLMLTGPCAMRAQQLQVQLGADLFVPQKGAADYFDLGVGPALGVEYALNGHFATTFETGYAFLFMNKDLTGTTSSTSMIPVQIGTKFFLTEDHKSPYFQMLVGAFQTDFMILREFAGTSPSIDSGWRPSVSIGGGFQRSRFDLGLRYVFLFNNVEERDKEIAPWEYLSVQARYAFFQK